MRSGRKYDVVPTALPNEVAIDGEACASRSSLSASEG